MQHTYRNLLVLLFVMTFASRAWGDPPAAAVEPEPNWSVGAGVNGGVYLTPATATGSNLPASVPTRSTPQMSTFVERRLAGENWLLLGASFAYGANSGSEVVTGSLQFIPVKSSAFSGSAVLGFRSQIGVWGPVRLSWLAAAGVSGVSETSTYDTNPGQVVKQSSTALNVNVGVSVDVALTKNLAVRLATPVLYGSYVSQSVTDSLETMPLTITAPNGTGYWMGFAFSPSLELRLAF